MGKITRNHIWWIYWLFLTAFMSSLLYFRRDSLALSPTVFDLAISVTWLALLLTPLFQEVTLFGLTLKKEFQDFKADVRDQLLNIKLMMQVRNSVSVQYNPVIVKYPMTAPSVTDDPDTDHVEEEA